MVAAVSLASLVNPNAPVYGPNASPTSPPPATIPYTGKGGGVPVDPKSVITAGSLAYGTPYMTGKGGPARNDRAYFDSLDEAGRRWWTENKMGNFYDVAAYRSTPEFFNSLSAADRQKWTDNKMGAYYKGLLSGDIAYGTMAPGGVDWNPETRATAGNAAGNWADPTGGELTKEQFEALAKSESGGYSGSEFERLTPNMTPLQRAQYANKYGPGGTGWGATLEWYAKNGAAQPGNQSEMFKTPPTGTTPPTTGTTPPPGSPPPTSGGGAPGAINKDNATAYFNTLSEAEKQNWVKGKWGAYYASGGTEQYKPGGGPPPPPALTPAPTHYNGPPVGDYTTSLAKLAQSKIAPTDAGNPMDFFDDEGYQFRKKQGMDGIQNSAAAGGSLQSGNTLKALANFNSGLASSEYGAAADRWRNQRDFNYGAASKDRDFQYGANRDLRDYDSAESKWGATFNNNNRIDSRNFDYASMIGDRNFNEDGRRFDLGFNYGAAKDDRNFNWQSLTDLAKMGLSAADSTGRTNMTGALTTGQNNLTGAGATGAAGVGSANISGMTISELLAYLANKR